MQEKALLDSPNDLFHVNFGFMNQFNRTDPSLFCQRWKMTSKLAKIRISQLDGQKRATLLLPKVAIFFIETLQMAGSTISPTHPPLYMWMYFL